MFSEKMNWNVACKFVCLAVADATWGFSIGLSKHVVSSFVDLGSVPECKCNMASQLPPWQGIPIPRPVQAPQSHMFPPVGMFASPPMVNVQPQMFTPPTPGPCFWPPPPSTPTTTCPTPDQIQNCYAELFMKVLNGSFPGDASVKVSEKKEASAAPDSVSQDQQPSKAAEAASSKADPPAPEMPKPSSPDPAKAQGVQSKDEEPRQSMEKEASQTPAAKRIATRVGVFRINGGKLEFFARFTPDDPSMEIKPQEEKASASDSGKAPPKAKARPPEFPG